MKLLDGVEGDAVLSPCGRFRYLLTRIWDWSRPPAIWVMLNPSTADASSDDQTLRRVQAYSRREGAGGASIVNLFAYRSTDPAELRHVDDPVGEVNDIILESILGTGRGLAVVAWGAGAHRFPARVQEVLDLAERVGRHRLYRLGAPLKDGHPRHPCRVGDGLTLEEYR